MITTGDPVLDDISREYKRLGNIDTFNNACACFYDLRTWDRMGRPKRVINETYALSPWFATLKNRMGT